MLVPTTSRAMWGAWRDPCNTGCKQPVKEGLHCAVGDPWARRRSIQPSGALLRHIACEAAGAVLSRTSKIQWSVEVGVTVFRERIGEMWLSFLLCLAVFLSVVGRKCRSLAVAFFLPFCRSILLGTAQLVGLALVTVACFFLSHDASDSKHFYNKSAWRRLCCAR